MRRSWSFVCLLITLCCIQTTVALRSRRSTSPFGGSGGSTPYKMTVSRDHWHCGSSDGASKDYSFNEVSKNCPSLAAQLNHCCAVHDDCYGQQLGQTECDNQFCECNRLAARIPTEDSFRCRGMLDDACLVLKFMGHFAYGDSNYTDPTKPSNVEPITPSTVPELKEDYLYMYEVCPYVNITLASCSYNFDLCAQQHSVDFCANDLCSCILDASEMDTLHHKECNVAVTHTCRRALSHSTAMMNKWGIQINFTFVTISLLILIVAFIGYFLWNRAMKQRKEEVSPVEKKPHMHTVESSRSVNPLLLNAD